MEPISRLRCNQWAAQRLLLRASQLRADAIAANKCLTAAKHIMCMTEPLSHNLTAPIDDGDEQDTAATTEKNIKVLSQLPGVGKSTARHLAEVITDTKPFGSSPTDGLSSINGSNTIASSSMNYDEATLHIKLLQEWLPHLNPRLMIVPVGAYRRGVMAHRSLHLVVTDTSSRLSEDENAVYMDKIVQFLSHKRYALTATPISSAEGRVVRLRATLDFVASNKRLPSQPEKELQPFATNIIHLHWQPFDTVYASTLLSTGPVPFAASMFLAATKAGFKLSTKNGLQRNSSSAPVMVRSELQLFQLLGLPYVHPIDR